MAIVAVKPVVQTASVRRTPPLSWYIPGGIILSAAGALAVAESYRAAQNGASPATYYAAFWLGALLLVAPATVGSLRVRAGEASRAWALLALGVCTYIPKFLRNPYGPLFHDEIAHFRAVQELIRTHHLYSPNSIIPIIADFPGLHIVTAAVEQLSGLNFWTSATIVILVAHCSALMAVYFLGRLLFRNSRGAALLAVLYATNSGFLYFDTEFAYESLAVAYLFWIIGITALAAFHHDRQAPAITLAVLLTLACVVTHHLTTLVLILVCLIAVVIHLLPIRRRRDGARGREWLPFAVIEAVAAAGLGGWVIAVAHETYAYLRPYVGAASRELAGEASGASGGRALYAASVQPLYERVLGFLSPLVMALVYLITAIRTRLFLRWTHRRTLLALVVFGAAYFPSLLFILSPAGAEGARRSWDFTYIGVAACVVAGAGPWLARHWQRRSVRWLCGAALAGLLIGNTGAGLDDPYRFPGPYLYGSDTRSLTTEDIGIARAFGRLHPGARVVTDRYTGLALVGYGEAFTAAPSAGFPAYQLFMTPGTPAPYLVHELVTSGYRYLVVDSRIARVKPQIGTYFEPDEPNPLHISSKALAEQNTVSWATKVLATNHYSVYRLSFDAAGVPNCSTPGCKVGAG